MRFKISCLPGILRGWVVFITVFAGMAVALSAAAETAGRVVLVVGDVRMAGEALRVGDEIRVGAPLATGSDGYLYIKTEDKGFLILRPGSTATVVAYHVDPSDPAESRFKIELHQGVARNISGEAVANARKNFRFNTPVAAIGVRGTDFTVYTDEQVTRVAVLSGGVVVSGFDDACSRAGHGPCEGGGARELFANQPGTILQVGRGQGAAQLLKGGILSPDSLAPPRNDEPAAGTTGRTPSGAADPNLDPLRTQRLTLAPEPSAPDTGRPVIEWGRWRPLANEAASLDLVELAKTHRLEAFNQYYALLRPNDLTWNAPASGQVDFRLQAAQAVIQQDGAGGHAVAVENGKLSINFAAARFTTNFDLVDGARRVSRQAEGGVFPGGVFQNFSQFLPGSNMLVNGVLAQDSTLRAGYLFQSRVDDGRIAYGATIWAK